MTEDILFSVDTSHGKKIEMNYLVQSRKLFIWLDKEKEEPKVIDINYENIAKSKEDFYQIFIGDGNDVYVKNAWTTFSDLINPCIYEYYQTKIKKENGSGNDNDNDDGLTDEYAEALNKLSGTTAKSEEEEDELAEIPNRDYSGHVIETIKKEVKRDDVLVRQVFYTALSAYTFDPINLGILSPTSEGKSYTTEKVTKYFPKEDIWNIGAWSNKVLIRQKGVLINSKGESIQKQIDKLRDEIRDTNTITATIRLEPPEKAPTDAEGKPIKINERVKMK